jgi:hypothetical protein
MVERGILHRYREYGLGKSSADGELRPPITGAEYLEKIVHLPVHVPPPSWDGVREFVETEYAQLLATLEVEERRQLLELFELSMPPVPRKVIRALELFAMLHELARQERPGVGEGVKYEPVLLARIVLLQLFAPELHRVRRSRRSLGFLTELQTMSGKLVPEVIAEIEGVPDEADASEGDRYLRQIKAGLRRKVAVILGRILEQRVDFDPREVLDPSDNYEWGPRLEFHWSLVAAEQKPAAVPVEVVAAEPETESVVALGHDMGMITRVRTSPIASHVVCLGSNGG